MAQSPQKHGNQGTGKERIRPASKSMVAQGKGEVSNQASSPNNGIGPTAHMPGNTKIVGGFVKGSLNTQNPLTAGPGRDQR